MADTIWYRVQPNDSPAMIARKLTGNPARMTEMVLANPGKPKVVIDGTMTFGGLRAGELVMVPGEWARRAPTGLNGTGVGTVQDDIHSILGATLAAAFALKTAGDNTPETVVTGNAADDTAAIQKYRDAATSALNVMGNVNLWALDLQDENPQINLASIQPGMTLAQNAATALTEPAATPDRSQAQQAATDVIGGAQQVLTAAKAIASNASSSGGAPANATTAAAALANYVAQNGCNGSGPYKALVEAFQGAYNADMAAGKYPGSPAGKPLGVDGVVAGTHSHNTLTALGQVSSQYAALCSIPHAPPSTVPPGGTTPTPGGTTPTPGGSPAQNVNVTTAPAATPWGLILGGVALAAGAGALYYHQTQKKPAAPHHGRRLTA